MPVIQGSSLFKERLEKLSKFTVNKLNEIVAQEAKAEDSHYDISNANGYLFNESMVMMQLIEMIIQDYKFKIADAFDVLEDIDTLAKRSREQWK